MKRFLLTFAALAVMLSFAYKGYAAGVAHGSNVWYETYNTCCVVLDERHWSVDFAGAGCSDKGNPKYQGSTISAGHWRDTNTWQLTKTWMVTHGCLSVIPCVMCTQTSQGCDAYDFTAICSIY